MAALIPEITASKGERTASQAAFEERAAKLKALDSELAAVNRGAAPIVTVNNSSGVQQTFLDNTPAPAPTVAKKADVDSLHPRAAAVASTISADAATLYSLVLRADEAYRGSQLIGLPGYEIARALAITEKDALAARGELEQRGLIVFQDNGAGLRGFRPRS